MSAPKLNPMSDPLIAQILDIARAGAAKALLDAGYDEPIRVTKERMISRLRAVGERLTTDAANEIGTLRMQLEAAYATTHRLHEQLRALRIKHHGSCETCCEDYGYIGDDSQPCPECNPDGDQRDAQ